MLSASADGKKPPARRVTPRRQLGKTQPRQRGSIPAASAAASLVAKRERSALQPVYTKATLMAAFDAQDEQHQHQQHQRTPVKAADPFSEAYGVDLSKAKRTPASTTARQTARQTDAARRKSEFESPQPSSRRSGAKSTPNHFLSPTMQSPPDSLYAHRTNRGQIFNTLHGDLEPARPKARTLTSDAELQDTPRLELVALTEAWQGKVHRYMYRDEDDIVECEQRQHQPTAPGYSHSLQHSLQPQPTATAYSYSHSHQLSCC